MLGIPLKHIFASFALYVFAKSLASCCLDDVKYIFPIYAVIGLQIVAIFSIFKNDAAILNSVRQLTIFAIIMATIVSMIVPDYFSDGIEKDANNIAPENPGNKNSVNSPTFVYEILNEFEKRFYYLEYVFYFFIQILFFDRQIHEIEQETGVFLNESTLWRHFVGIYKFVAETVMYPILEFLKVKWDCIFPMRYETRLLILIYIFEISIMVFRTGDPSSLKLDRMRAGVQALVLIITFSSHLLLLFIFSPEPCRFIVVLYPTIIAIFASCLAIISALYYSVFPHTSDLVGEKSVIVMKVLSGGLVMILEQHPTHFYLYRFMFNIFAICVAIFKCSIMFSMIRDCREGRIAGHKCAFK